MKQVTQTITVGDGSGLPGNCLQAAVASLLELDLDEVPHFARYDDWLERLVAFAEERGHRVLYRPASEPVAFGLAFGQSPRGVFHAVTVVNGETWDPHPSRDGLVSVANYVAWMKTNPIRRRRTTRLRVYRAGGEYFHEVWVGHWYAVCPTCGEELSATGENGSTRKRAKDALHVHMQKRHAGPGGSRT